MKKGRVIVLMIVIRIICLEINSMKYHVHSLLQDHSDSSSRTPNMSFQSVGLTRSKLTPISRIEFLNCSNYLQGYSSAINNSSSRLYSQKPQPLILLQLFRRLSYSFLVLTPFSQTSRPYANPSSSPYKLLRTIKLGMIQNIEGSLS